MGLRAAGRYTESLTTALAAMVLGDEDQALIEQARSLAERCDTETDPRLAVRYEAHYARSLQALSKRSDAAGAREAARPERRPPSRMEDFRSRFRAWETERQASEARNARRAAKLKAQGQTVEQIGAAMKADPIIVRQWLEMASETVTHSPGGVV